MNVCIRIVRGRADTITAVRFRVMELTKLETKYSIPIYGGTVPVIGAPHHAMLGGGPRLVTLKHNMSDPLLYCRAIVFLRLSASRMPVWQRSYAENGELLLSCVVQQATQNGLKSTNQIPISRMEPKSGRKTKSLESRKIED